MKKSIRFLKKAKSKNHAKRDADRFVVSIPTGREGFSRRNALCGAGGEREPHPGCILLGLALIDYYRANPNELRLMRREGE